MRDACEIRRSIDATWIVVGVSAAALLAACLFRKIAIGVNSGMVVLATTALMISLATLVRRRGWKKIADWLTSTAQLTFLTAVLTALSYVLASTNMPLQDGLLVAADRAIGIDWRSLVDAFARHPGLMLLLNWAYASFAVQIALFPPLAFLTGNGRIGSQFVLAWSIALAASVVIFPLAPALGGYLYHHLEPSDYPNVQLLFAWQFVPPLHALREGNLNVVELGTLDGIITFPSFHAAVAVLLGWAAWRIPYLRYPMLVLNGFMLVSAVPIGGHYVTDVIVGSLLAAASVLAVWAWVRPVERRISFSTVRAGA